VSPNQGLSIFVDWPAREYVSERVTRDTSLPTSPPPPAFLEPQNGNIQPTKDPKEGKASHNSYDTWFDVSREGARGLVDGNLLWLRSKNEIVSPAARLSTLSG